MGFVEGLFGERGETVFEGFSLFFTSASLHDTSRYSRVLIRRVQQFRFVICRNRPSSSLVSTVQKITDFPA
jgi:hypothetical protein